MADGKPPSNLGCVIAIIAFPIVVLAGLFVGALLRADDDGPDERSVTLDQGEIDGTEWRIDAVRDVEGATCAFSYLDDVQSTGACSFDPQDETIGDRTIVFGRAAAGATDVSVELTDGETVEIDTVAVDGVDGRFYVTVVDGDVDAVGPGS